MAKHTLCIDLERPNNVKGLGFAEDKTESNPQNRRLGYARVSTYGQT